jgi:hypothetical protein
VKHPPWGMPVEEWICPETGTRYTTCWRERGEDVCDQCRPNGPTLGQRLSDLNEKRAGNREEE